MKSPILKAIMICKSGDFQCRVFELSIQDGKVIGKRTIDRGAGDLPQIQIARAETVLWSHKDGQVEDDLSRIKDI